jgi:hypothetical protein
MTPPVMYVVILWEFGQGRGSIAGRRPPSRVTHSHSKISSPSPRVCRSAKTQHSEISQITQRCVTCSDFFVNLNFFKQIIDEISSSLDV